MLLFLSAYAPLFLIFALRFERWQLWVPCAVLCVVGVVAGPLVLRAFRGVTAQALPLKTVEDRGAEVSGYLAGYIVPFVAAKDPEPGQILGYAVFILLAAVIYLRSTLVQINPTLYFFGWRVVSIQVGEGWSGHLLTKRNLPAGATIRGIRLTERVYIDDARAARGS